MLQNFGMNVWKYQIAAFFEKSGGFTASKENIYQFK